MNFNSWLAHLEGFTPYAQCQWSQNLKRLSAKDRWMIATMTRNGQNDNAENKSRQDEQLSHVDTFNPDNGRGSSLQSEAPHCINTEFHNHIASAGQQGKWDFQINQHLTGAVSNHNGNNKQQQQQKKGKAKTNNSCKASLVRVNVEH